MFKVQASSRKSTIVRAVNRAKLGGLRLSFRALDRLAPDLGSRWATRLWCTPPTGAARLRDDRPGDGESRLLDTPAGRIHTETWGLPGSAAPVYLMHGWGGRRGQLGALVEPLLDRGHRVVAFDVPGHGDSGPGHLGRGQSSVLDFSRGLTEVVARHGAPAAVVAHSLGACGAAIAVGDGLDVPRLALIAPNNDPLGRAADFARVFGFTERIQNRMLARIERLGGRPLEDFLVTDLPRRATPPPTRILHDRRDKEVPYAEGVALAEAWPSAELVTTEGLGHGRILRDPEVIAAVVDFATKKG